MLTYPIVILVGTILFALSTVCFYFCPRTIAGAVVVAIMLENTGPLVRLCHSSIDAAVISITLVMYLWFVPGLILDVAEFRDRRTRVLSRIKTAKPYAERRNEAE